jgi:hypothetical protein
LIIDEITLEIWNKKNRIISFNCKEYHSTIYTDDYFQNISFDEKEEKFLYVAERKKKEKKEFWECNEKENILYEINEYEEDFGEDFSKKYQSRIFLFDINNEKLEEITVLNNYSIFFPSFGPNDNGVNIIL